MLRRQAPAGSVLPAVPQKVQAFAYRPYGASLAGEDGSTVCAGDDSDSGGDADTPAAKIVWRAPTAESDRRRMDGLQEDAAHRRIREARSLVDDTRFEFACDAVYECQRG
ncbi:hypothetical protein H4R21_000757 [Coemansia helicoidea]|uniref:Uncharacterized protein n=1 Tax=Coemansia helicoidea TaxID=1286919 RepID=A0ACC1LFS1_9FUNG|nr:hypothetical protein H4R21_000757 [Coemansia helicoidea]